MTYLTARQAAAELQTSVAELYRMLGRGEIRGSQRAPKCSWRFEPEDIQAWIDEHENRPRSRKRRKRSA